MEVLTPSSEELAAIRVLIPDTDAIYGVNEDEYLFTDENYTSFFSVGEGSVLRAAGYAMIAIGNSEAMISKVIISQDLETDGAKAQKEWREAGRALLARADKGDADSEVIFDLIDFREGWMPYPPELTEAPFDGRWPYGY
jgi:hypothetical protein